MQVNSISVNPSVHRKGSAKNTAENINSTSIQDCQQAPLSALQAYSKINFKGSCDNCQTKNVIILLGAPNSGKGTFSNKVSKRYDIPQISTGDILKREIKAKSELGLKVKSYIDDGALVPDSLIINIVKKRITEPDCEKGFILDGFPRTKAQAEKLNDMLGEMPNVKLKVLNLDVPEEVLYERSANRKICSDCSKSFNIREYKEENCDEDGCNGKLIKRSDDTPEVLTSRLEEYHIKTQPVSDFYAESGQLTNIDIDAAVGRDCPPEKIMARLVDAIETAD